MLESKPAKGQKEIYCTKSNFNGVHQYVIMLEQMKKKSQVCLDEIRITFIEVPQIQMGVPGTS